VLAEAGIENVMRWVPFDLDEADLRNRIKNKMIRPTTIPQTLEELMVEQALCREALRLAMVQHKALAVGLKGVQQTRTIADTFDQTTSGETLVSLEKLALIVGSGGVLSHAPRRQQAMLMMTDAFLPEGLTRMAVDSIFMMPQLGVLSTVHPQAATEVFEKDCLIPLGTVVAPWGELKDGKTVFRARISLPGGDVTPELRPGDLQLLPLGVGERARGVFEPGKNQDFGAGRGKAIESEVTGGVVGILLDARGRRPFRLSADAVRRVRVTESTVFRKTRRLPLRGEVMVAVGDSVTAEQIVARTALPGNVKTVNVASLLGVPPADVPGCMLKPTGSSVVEGEILARSKSLFGLMKSTAAASTTGTIELVSEVTGQVALREPAIPVEMSAYVDGRVSEILPEEGVIVEAQGAWIQGIFGIGGEGVGILTMAASSPDQILGPEALGDVGGQVLVVGAEASCALILGAREKGAVAVVAGGISDQDLRKLLGVDLGVAITGSEDLGITVIVTEGFGRLPIAHRTFDLLGKLGCRKASVNGATQIRAGVQRPEILVPQSTPGPESVEAVESGLALGMVVRIIREPYFGRLGRVLELPSPLVPLETEARVRVLRARLEDGQEVTVPRANVEMIEG
jgi:hypothetical protein